ncbi:MULTISPECIES: helix-turn-helix domain-containing protein [Kosmotoga]|jgi:DNA-binding XRE family transcriptional regulator|uniref:Transcriptional regulator, XRE family n=1 Tax=Kosmotoga olearia (strain ATCC BAA-1733 / DSM 21960 / TBF 19.5.1) TaxID=521045 RepID=C5CHV7_KOSOT|nr:MULTISPECIES: helix-turn-helix transcriptional regulator [Kosmotoga]ACR78812.1 transcriptional regulator, XRE family [Kosmotoga olearia TBF 19.5.1]MDI3524628.1 hypothetical protein [Kosmotoga sp.]OAA25174.1 XRE family transcriptional regulator [Kosmotoga sp. DU53]
MNLLVYSRLQFSLTQKELGRLIGKDSKYISAVERERIKPPFYVSDNIAYVLKMPVEVLFPNYVRRSRLPNWKELMYLRSLGYNIEVYRELVSTLTQG